MYSCIVCLVNPLGMAIGQQMKEEGHDKNYQWFSHLTFHSFAT